MFKPLPTPKEISKWDQISINEFGLLAEILMENASREALYVLKEKFASLKQKTAIIFAGSGNNGGDAFALARHLVNHEVKVMILHAKPLKEYRGTTAGYHLKLAKKMDIPLMHLPEYNMDFLPPVDIVIDGLLGTGLSGELRSEYITWIKRINNLGKQAFVLSLDIPSGLNGETGEPCPVAVFANATITFEEAKLGLFLPPARPYTGELKIGKIGIPKKIKQDYPCSHYALTEKVLDLLTPPPSTLHKGTAGHVLIIGGSPGLCGAPQLAALGALRSGAGLVTVACPYHLKTEVKGCFPEIMTISTPQNKDYLGPEILEIIQEHLDKFKAIVFGPGLGRHNTSLELLKAYLKIDTAACTVFDADSLYFFALHPELFDLLKNKQNVIFTPHPGEMARFFNVTAAEINKKRARYARNFINQYQVNLILKGAATIIATPARPLYVSPFATPNLALGGSGDILAGILGSLLGQKYSPFVASCLGVYLHGLTGKDLATQYPYRGNLAQEIAHNLPLVLAKYKIGN
ncbi:MAG: NAD(P)H-hydrate dehydratase [Desulfonauticus sp.]|nr:NAD(P)H-hydrate dehydratase [Desulfonauticus sp.]